jgi:hypothetical protein
VTILLLIVPVLTALVGAGGAWLLGISGLITVRLTQKRDDATTAIAKQEADTAKHAEASAASKTLIDEALSLVNQFSAQVKDLRAEQVSMEAHFNHENQILREQNRLLAARVADLELENTKLKAQLFDFHTADRARRQIQ